MTMGCCENLDTEFCRKPAQLPPHIFQNAIVQAILHFIDEYHSTAAFVECKSQRQQPAYSIPQKAYWNRAGQANVGVNHWRRRSCNGQQSLDSRIDPFKTARKVVGIAFKFGIAKSPDVFIRPGTLAGAQKDI